ncbi:MAG: proline dehydrogenase family protein [Proteobacteria bacterium]|nr:proline dehydrogenase family protein [Pseudomonadota bacterium]
MSNAESVDSGQALDNNSKRMPCPKNRQLILYSNRRQTPILYIFLRTCPLSRHLPNFSNTEIAFSSKSNTQLFLARSLFQLIQCNSLVHVGGKLLNFGFKMGLPLSSLVRWNIFRHFCGGESIEECRTLMQKQMEKGVFSILDYGVEGEKTESGFNASTAEIIRTAKEAARSSEIAFIVFKFTAIASTDLLERVSRCRAKKSPLSDADQIQWTKVEARVDQICKAALDAKRPLMIDAEETWIQLAIDELAKTKMKQCNISGPCIYITFQMYRVDSLNRLKEIHEEAKRDSWHLGVKLVRGAYMEKEREYAQKQNLASPIHPTKDNTDQAYDSALEYCLANLESIGLCAGTHNEKSTVIATTFALQHSDQSPLKIHVKNNLWFSQLLGMSDNLTYNLAAAGLNAAKYVPYGPVHSVLPYLLRRAQENTSVNGQSSRELQLLDIEFTRRKG